MAMQDSYATRLPPSTFSSAWCCTLHTSRVRLGFSFLPDFLQRCRAWPKCVRDTDSLRSAKTAHKYILLYTWENASKLSGNKVLHSAIESSILAWCEPKLCNHAVQLRHGAGLAYTYLPHQSPISLPFHTCLLVAITLKVIPKIRTVSQNRVSGDMCLASSPKYARNVGTRDTYISLSSLCTRIPLIYKV